VHYTRGALHPRPNPGPERARQPPVHLLRRPLRRGNPVPGEPRRRSAPP